MTRGEAIKDFFCKTILPVAAAALLYCIFRSACVKTGELDYLWLWILCCLLYTSDAAGPLDFSIIMTLPLYLSRKVDTKSPLGDCC